MCPLDLKFPEKEGAAGEKNWMQMFALTEKKTKQQKTNKQLK